MTAMRINMIPPYPIPSSRTPPCLRGCNTATDEMSPFWVHVYRFISEVSFGVNLAFSIVGIMDGKSIWVCVICLSVSLCYCVDSYSLST